MPDSPMDSSGLLDRLRQFTGAPPPEEEAAPAAPSQPAQPAQRLAQFAGSAPQSGRPDELEDYFSARLRNIQETMGRAERARDSRPYDFERDWREAVLPDLREHFAGVPLDLDELRRRYLQAGRGANEAARLMAFQDLHRRRDENPNAYDDTADVASRLPFVGGVHDTAYYLQLRNAAERVGAGNGRDEDYDRVGRYLADQERNQNRSFLGTVGNIASYMPGYAAEFAATGGTFTAAREAAARTVTSVLGRLAGQRVAGSLAGRAVAGTAGFAAGALAQTAANPQRIAAEAAQRTVPTIGLGDGGVAIGPARSFVSQLPAGFLDTVIELGTERFGAALPWAGGHVGRGLARGAARGGVVGQLATAAGIVNRALLGSEERATGLVGRLLAQGGFHGVAGEIFEERAGDFLRGLTGLRDDYGVFSMNARAASRQLLAEGLAFSLFSGANRVGRLAERLVAGPVGRGPGGDILEWAQRAPTREFLTWAGRLDIPLDGTDARVWTERFGEQGAQLQRVVRERLPEDYRVLSNRAQRVEAARSQEPGVRSQESGVRGQESGAAQAVEDYRRAGREALDAFGAALDQELGRFRQQLGAEMPSAIREAYGQGLQGPGVPAPPLQGQPSLSDLAKPLPGAAPPSAPAAQAGQLAAAETTPAAPALAPRQQALADQFLKMIGNRTLDTAESWRQFNKRRIGRGQSKLSFAEFDALLGEMEDARLIDTYELKEGEGDVQPGRYVEAMGEPPLAEQQRIAREAAAIRAENEGRAAGPAAAGSAPTAPTAAQSAPTAATVAEPQGPAAQPVPAPPALDLARHDQVAELVNQLLGDKRVRRRGWSFKKLHAELRENGLEISAEDLRRHLDKMVAQGELVHGGRNYLINRKIRLLDIIKDGGGVSIRSLRALGYDIKNDFFHAGMAWIISPAPHAMGLDEWGALLERQGHLRVPASRHAYDILMEKLKEDAISALHNFEAEIDREQRRYYEEQAAAQKAEEEQREREQRARRAGHSEGAVERSTRRGQEIADAAAQPAAPAAAPQPAPEATRPVQDAGGQLADQEGDLAGEPRLGELGPADTDFDPSQLGYRAPQPGNLARRPPATAEGEAGPFEIIQTASRLFEVPYYIGKVSKKFAAVHLTRPEAVMVGRMYAGNAAIFMHEVAHDIDKKLGVIPDLGSIPENVLTGLRQLDYEPGRRDHHTAAKEGFAEYIRMRVTGQLVADTPAKKAALTWLTGRLRAHPETVAKLTRIRAMFRAFEAQSPGAQAGALISVTGQEAKAAGITTGEAAGAAAQTAWDTFHDAVVDNLGPLHRMEKELARRGTVFPEGKSPSALFFAMMHMPARWATRMVEEGMFAWQGDRFEIIGKPLKEILAPLTAADLAPSAPGQPSRFEVYLVGRHILQEAAKGRTPAGPQTLEFFQNAMREDLRDRDFLQRARVAGDNMTQAFNDTLRGLVSVGFLEQEKADRLIADKPTYVSLARVQKDTGWRRWFQRKGEMMPSPVRVRIGSDEQIVSPILSLVQRYHLVSFLMAEQQKRASVDELARQEGTGPWLVEVPRPVERHFVSSQGLEQILKQLNVDDAVAQELIRAFDGVGASYFAAAPWPKSGKPTYVVMRQGKPVYYQIGDKALYDLLTSQQGHDNPFLIFLRAARVIFAPFAKAVRFGATGASYGFQAFNIFPLRDPLTFWRNTINATSVKDLPGKYARSYRFAWAVATGRQNEVDDALMKLYHAGSGSQQRAFAFGQHGPQAVYKEATGQTGTVIRVVRSIGEGILEVLGAGENAPRAQEALNYLKKAGYTEEDIRRAMRERPNEDPVPFHVFVGMMNAASESTTPFPRLGYATRDVNALIPFFGPTIAAIAKNVRSVRAHPLRAAFILAGLMGLKLLQWWRYKDDEDYNELEPHWRFNYLMVKMPWGQWWALPSTRDLDSIAVGLFEESLRASSQSNPNFAGWVGQSIEQVTPPLAPEPLRTAFNVARNRSWTGAPIVPGRAQHRSESEQWLRYRVPYILEQLTGGLTSPGRYRFNPFARAYFAPNLSVDRFHEELQGLESRRLSARDAGRAFPDQGRYQFLQTLRPLIQDAGAAIRGGTIGHGARQVTVPPATQEQAAAIERFRTGLARLAMGERPLQDNPLRNLERLRPELAQEVRHFLEVQAWHFSEPPPNQHGLRPDVHQRQQADWERSKTLAQRFLELAGVSAAQRQELVRVRMLGQAQQSGRPLRGSPANLQRLGRAGAP